MNKRIKARLRKLPLFVAACLLAAGLSSCAVLPDGLHDGYYAAEMERFDEYGWKEYMILYISDNEIVTIEYNAKNPSGFIKSWDMDYMREMNAVDHTYPNEYTRGYAETLLSRQDPAKVDAITGATHSHETFQLLAEAALEQSRAGDKSIALVKKPD